MVCTVTWSFCGAIWWWCRRVAKFSCGWVPGFQNAVSNAGSVEVIVSCTLCACLCWLVWPFPTFWSITWMYIYISDYLYSTFWAPHKGTWWGADTECCEQMPARSCVKLVFGEFWSCKPSKCVHTLWYTHSSECIGASYPCLRTSVCLFTFSTLPLVTLLFHCYLILC